MLVFDSKRATSLAAAIVGTALLAVSLAGPATAAGPDGLDVDAQFVIARELAYAGQWDEAVLLAHRILAGAPDYTDVTVFLARVTAWQKQYPEARGLLQQVLEREPNNIDARKALVDVEFWSGRPQDALRLCDATLALQPDDSDLQAKRTQIRDSLAAAQPSDSARAGSRYRGSIDYTYSTFSKDLDDWNQVAVALERKTQRGSLIGRTTYFDRFRDDAVMFELDAYPKLRPGTYAYLSGGVSTGDVVAKYRLAAELYQLLPWQTEVSLGWRQLKFDATGNVLTGSVGVYIGNYWLVLRPYVTFLSGEQEAALTLQGRWYYGDEEEFGTITLGTGKSLEENTANQQLFSLTTHNAGLELRKRLIAGYVGKMGFGFELQELPGRSDREQYTVGVGFDYLF